MTATTTRPRNLEEHLRAKQAAEKARAAIRRMVLRLRPDQQTSFDLSDVIWSELRSLQADGQCEIATYGPRVVVTRKPTPGAFMEPKANPRHKSGPNETAPLLKLGPGGDFTAEVHADDCPTFPNRVRSWFSGKKGGAS